MEVITCGFQREEAKPNYFRAGQLLALVGWWRQFERFRFPSTTTVWRAWQHTRDFASAAPSTTKPSIGAGELKRVVQAALLALHLRGEIADRMKSVRFE
jgi:hypothetical protein